MEYIDHIHPEDEEWKGWVKELEDELDRQISLRRIQVTGKNGATWFKHLALSSGYNLAVKLSTFPGQCGSFIMHNLPMREEMIRVYSSAASLLAAKLLYSQIWISHTEEYPFWGVWEELGWRKVEGPVFNPHSGNNVVYYIKDIL